jgi:outer membrane protein insertion porin family
VKVIISYLWLKVIQGSFQGGFMKRLNDEKLIYICDRFFLGGPHTIRGFQQRGIGPQSDNQALGAQVISTKKTT